MAGKSSTKILEEARPGTANSLEDGIVEDLGYHQSYRRVFKGLGAFALVLAMASPMGGILIISSYQITYGGYWGLVWGWFIPAVIFFPQALAIAELCSSMPINGANYWWTAALAPPALSRPLSFISGWTSVVQVITGLASFSFACGLTLGYVIPVLQPEWIPTNAQVMGIAMAILLLWGASSFLHMENVNMVYIANCVIVILSTMVFLIALPTSHSLQSRPFTSANDVFGRYDNFSDWERPVAVPITFFSAAWVITGWNSPTYIAEDTHNARVVCPKSCLETWVALSIMGIFCCLAVAFCLTDLEAAVADSTGLPLYTLLLDHWGSKAGCAFLLIISGNSIVGGSSYLLASACQVAAFARDGGLPFSEKLARVNIKSNIPINAGLSLVCGALLVLLFGLSSTAGSIIFSLAVIAGLMNMALPIGLRIFAGDRFVPGPFNYGKFSQPIHIWAFLSLIYMTIMESFPLSKNWNIDTFNYNWVVALGAIVGSIIGWFVLGKNYPGLDLGAVQTWRIQSQGVPVNGGSGLSDERT
ncbi:amino acid/polyamine transporter I [Dactylonectria macrodidyma]|uniref:Amino acid/polyamine transporter I n=1 Tax=Dactylonectria macrodidyma TaxID=307937 RepID=A0A9P9DYA5_9HYPO|nr:amino acid/polyamine transporter I [Dactylonectria macrodidyma]